MERKHDEAAAERAADAEILAQPAHDTGSFLYRILSFILPIIGIIAAVLFRKHNYMRNYKACKGGAVAGFIFLAVLLVIFVLLLVLAVI